MTPKSADEPLWYEDHRELTRDDATMADLQALAELEARGAFGHPVRVPKPPPRVTRGKWYRSLRNSEKRQQHP